MLARALLLSLAVSLMACDLESLGGDGGLEGLVGDATIREPTEEEREWIEEQPICGEMTLPEVLTADAISDECREALESLLPAPQNSADDRVILHGGAPDGRGGRIFYAQGLDAAGAPISAEAFASAEVISDGAPLVSTEVGVLPAVEIGGLVSLSLVNDYSASMRDGDLRIVESIHLDLIAALPPALEAEVTYFSDEVETRQPFTEDEALLAQSLALDPDYTRGSTALLDGVGVALERVDDRDRPLRIVVVSTDGGENASDRFTEAQVLSLIEDGEIFVIMLGALTADVPTLRRLSGARGVYFYARDARRLEADLAGFIESFSQMVEITVPASVESIEVRLP